MRRTKANQHRVLAVSLTLVMLPLGLACQGPAEQPVEQKPASPYSSQLATTIRQLPPTKIDYDRSLLSDDERKVVDKLVEASRMIDEIFFIQVSERNPGWRSAIIRDAQSGVANAAEALTWLRVNEGPWDRLDRNEPFLPKVGAKPKGAAFYPPDLTTEELEKWIEAHPEDAEAMRGLFTVVRRDGETLKAIPYSEYYRAHLDEAAKALREAAELSSDAALKDYLAKRADAFTSNDYYESDLAWMDLDGPIEIVIGPYEVYEDGLNNYKAAFESFVCVVDKGESAKLAVYAKHLPKMEMNLPIPAKHKNAKRGTASPIKVVQEIFTAGDARAGVQTAAFNLPNDERVRETKGSKKVLLKNVMEAKYEVTGKPIAERVLIPDLVGKLSFDAFFNHVLFHELSHGLGPGIITGPDGTKVEARLLLKDTYSTIEECKADTVGLWNILYAMDAKLIDAFDREQLFATYAGLLFRSMRFGLHEAHGGGTAIQWNWLRERDAIVRTDDGRYAIDLDKLPAGIESLSSELLMIEATGDYARAQRLMGTYAQSNEEIDAVIAKLADLPVDLRPVYTGVGER